jgi:hypothetical protein
MSKRQKKKDLAPPGANIFYVVLEFDISRRRQLDIGETLPIIQFKELNYVDSAKNVLPHP